MGELTLAQRIAARIVAFAVLHPIVKPVALLVAGLLLVGVDVEQLWADAERRTRKTRNRRAHQREPRP